MLRAARLLREWAGIGAGARLILDKRLPVASGIGGGSADAAAALRLLCRFWQVDPPEMELLGMAARLGADVPACVASRTCRGEGRGDRLVGAEPPKLGGTPLLLVNPRVALSTAAVFRAWDGVDRGPLSGFVEGRNDLEAPALSLAPEIGEVLELLTAQGPALARMSGSGATCFGLFDSLAERDAASTEIAAVRPHWWQLPSRIR